MRAIPRLFCLLSLAGVSACSTVAPTEPAPITLGRYTLSDVAVGGSGWQAVGAGISCSGVPSLGCATVRILDGDLTLDAAGSWTMTLRLRDASGITGERSAVGTWQSFGDPANPTLLFSNNASGILVVDAFGIARPLVLPGQLSGEAASAPPTTSIAVFAVPASGPTLPVGLSLRFTR